MLIDRGRTGFGGTNAHCIIESYGDFQQKTASVTAVEVENISKSMLPLVFSAASEKSLRLLVQSYQAYLESSPRVDLRSLAYTLA